MRLVVPGMLLGLVLGACGGGGGDSGTPVTPPVPARWDLGVTVTPPATAMVEGQGGSFTVVVANAGPDAASAATLQVTPSAALAVGSVTCAAAGGATCPATLGATLQLANVPSGGSLTFTVQVNANAAGAAGLTATATSANDTAAANNTALANTAITAGNALNGSYALYATNGRQYSLSINFDLMRLRVQGHGLDQSSAFTADATGGGYTVTANQRFRTPQDLIVGNFDFGAGALPFVAARSFVTSTNDLSGAVNVLGLVLPAAGGAGDSRIFTMQWSGSNLLLCTDNTIYTVANCPSASTRSYALTLNGTEFTGVYTGTGVSDTIHFRVARSGSHQVYLRSELVSDGTAYRFTVGLPNTSGLSASSYIGGHTLGRWGTLTLAPTTYAYTGVDSTGAAVSEGVATLNGVGPSGPTGIRAGVRTPDNAALFIMQSPVLAATVGARSGLAAGHIQLAAPESP